MSNFACESCGRPQVYKDDVGYVAGCSHNPPRPMKYVFVWFGGDLTGQMFIGSGGAWYKSLGSMHHGRAVHPIAWANSPELLDELRIGI